MKRKFYITTPVYYVNDVPHLGHAYTTIAADTLARYKRLRGYEVFFLTGTDEHGDKIARTAKEKSISPRELADKVVVRFQNLWEKLYISNDDFIRTTEFRHTEVVRKVFLKLYEQDDIYKGKYKGWYCIPCESFWLESQLKEGNLCPECGRKVEKVEEEGYFFRLSKYQKRLLLHLEKNPDFVLPPTRKNEVIKFVKSGLKDLSITRLKSNWGIPCPIQKEHTIYVWIDALLNYISAIGYPLKKEKFSFLWPADVQIVGKDILKFHAIIWPSLLMALGLKPPRMVFAHGWWKVNNEKMSKSKGNVVDPEEVAEKYGADSLRYFLLRDPPFGEDGIFSLSLFIKRVNSDLANDLGNLLNRTLPLVIKYYEGRIPYPDREKSDGIEIKNRAEETISQLDEIMNTLSFSRALSLIWEIVRSANLYIDRRAPWNLAKDKKREGGCGTVLYNVLDTLRIITLLIFPFIPQLAKKMWNQLGIKEELEKQILNEESIKKGITPGTEIKKGPPLFPRIEK
ncbi:MAG: methionine--tRNA ligase [Candidatus Aerophobetes bacterium]|nr:methionine--tRNA ligase [Candidatus Aerophobetes bacterium]